MGIAEAVEILESLKEDLNEDVTIPELILALEIAINCLRGYGRFSPWLGMLDSDEFDSKDQLLNTIKLKMLFCSNEQDAI